MKRGWSVLRLSRLMRLGRGLGNSNNYGAIVGHDYAEVKEQPDTRGDCSGCLLSGESNGGFGSKPAVDSRLPIHL